MRSFASEGVGKEDAPGHTGRYGQGTFPNMQECLHSLGPDEPHPTALRSSKEAKENGLSLSPPQAGTVARLPAPCLPTPCSWLSGCYGDSATETPS